MMLGVERISHHLFTWFLCFNYSLLLGSKNPTSSSSAIFTQRACVLAAASVRPLSGPSAGFVDVSPSQTSLWPRRPE